MSDTRNLTLNQRQAGTGMSHHRRFLICNHTGSTTGAQYRKGLGYVRCAACFAERKAQQKG